MGAENFVESSAGKRQAKRARVLLAVTLKTAFGDIEGRLRDLSRKGALVECTAIPPVGAEVQFVRGSTAVPARVAWTGGNRVGLEFAFMIDEHEVLVQLGPAVAASNQDRFRNPRTFGDNLSDQEKQLAKVWGSNVGIPTGEN